MTKKNEKELLDELFSSFLTGIRAKKSIEPKKYLETLGLDYVSLGIGFNSGQFHHRKELDFKQKYEAIGVLSKSSAAVNSPELTPFTCWGQYGVVFPLKNENADIVNLYAIRIKLESKPDMYLNQEGIYPAYPHSLTKRLYITSNIVDTASLIQSSVLDQRQSILALFNGCLIPQITKCITELAELQELVLIGVSDEVRTQLESVLNGVKIIAVNLPDGNSVNDMFLSYGENGLLNWLNDEITNKTVEPTPENLNKLIIHNENKIVFNGKAGKFEVLGRLPMDYASMKVSLNIITPTNQQKHRLKLDLYEQADVETNINRVCDKDSTVNYNLLESDLIELTDLLEKHREKLFDIETGQMLTDGVPKELTPAAEKQAIEFLKRPNLLNQIDKLLDQAGIIGENQIRLALFVIASTYKMPYTLHSLVQGESGSGKSHLINAIAECIPQEDLMNLTRITSKSFYYYGDNDLINKLIVIQDYDGLNEEAQYAFREMQSSGYLCSSAPVKDRQGNLQSKTRRVNAHFASLVATTRGQVYYDNMSRSIILGVDESTDQTNNIIQYQNQKLCGMIDDYKEEQVKQLLRNCIRVLKPYEVINPYANRINIPVEAQMKRRLNQQFQNYVAQITILNQYQRKKDDKGRLITTIEDLKAAVETFFPALFLKIDELDSSTRQFFENLKQWVSKQPQGTTTKFTERDVRIALNIGKSRMNEYVNILKDLEYLQVADGSANRGFRYTISYWDDIEKFRCRIQTELNQQIEDITGNTEK